MKKQLYHLVNDFLLPSPLTSLDFWAARLRSGSRTKYVLSYHLPQSLDEVIPLVNILYE